jgi:hypothetical protein
MGLSKLMDDHDTKNLDSWICLLRIVTVSVLVGITPISSSTEQALEISGISILSAEESLFLEKCLARFAVANINEYRVLKPLNIVNSPIFR